MKRKRDNRIRPSFAKIKDKKRKGWLREDFFSVGKMIACCSVLCNSAAAERMAKKEDPINLRIPFPEKRRKRKKSHFYTNAK